MTFHEKLGKLLDSTKLTRADCALAANVSVRFLYQVLDGTRFPSKGMLDCWLKLAKADPAQTRPGHPNAIKVAEVYDALLEARIAAEKNVETKTFTDAVEMTHYMMDFVLVQDAKQKKESV